MGGDQDAVDFVQAIAHVRMQDHRRLTRGLRMKLRREADLEQHIFHHVAGVFLRQFELSLALGLERQVLVGMAEQHVIEAPLRRAQHSGNAHLATQGDIRQAHPTAGGIPRRPGFARAGIRRVAIGAQRLAIDEGLGQRCQQLLATGPHQLGADRGGGDFTSST